MMELTRMEGWVLRQLDRKIGRTNPEIAQQYGGSLDAIEAAMNQLTNWGLALKGRVRLTELWGFRPTYTLTALGTQELRPSPLKKKRKKIQENPDA